MFDRLVMSSEEVGKLSRKQRVDRVHELVAESKDIVSWYIEEQVTSQRRSVAAVAVLYSGGNDSTVLAHMFRDTADLAIHANTGIGIEQTRQFVRETCDSWGLSLMEEHPPTSYEELVLDQGFPGPSMHWKMYQRLKERCLEQARRNLLSNPFKERVVFLAGRRRDESARRSGIPVSDRKGSMVFISPLINWTKLDLGTYRTIFDVPENVVSGLLHMSGECLCGSFAHAGELDEIAYWFPEVAEHIRELEKKVRAAGHKELVCRWGWGGETSERPSKVGVMCSSCDARHESGT